MLTANRNHIQTHISFICIKVYAYVYNRVYNIHSKSRTRYDFISSFLDQVSKVTKDYGDPLFCIHHTHAFVHLYHIRAEKNKSMNTMDDLIWICVSIYQRMNINIYRCVVYGNEIDGKMLLFRIDFVFVRACVRVCFVLLTNAIFRTTKPNHFQLNTKCLAYLLYCVHIC